MSHTDTDATGRNPAWLEPILDALSTGQDPTAARDWTRRTNAELGRLDGRVPFAAVHRWYARTIAPMLREAGIRRGGTGESQRALEALHVRATGGERIDETTWYATLEPALREVYRLAYGYADAYATAYASAHHYAGEHDYTDAETVEFSHYYADLNTGANVRSYADANAIANARATARAYASGDADTFAEAYPFALINAAAHAEANLDETIVTGPSDVPDRTDALRAAYRRLADGLTASLAATPNR